MSIVTFLLPQGAPLNIMRNGLLINSPPQPEDEVYIKIQLEDEKYKYIEIGVITSVIQAGRGESFYICPPSLPNDEAIFIPNGSTPINQDLKVMIDSEKRVMVNITVKYHYNLKNMVCIFGENIHL